MTSTRIKLLSTAVMLLTAVDGSQRAAAVTAFDNIDPNHVGARGGYYLGSIGFAEAKYAQRFTATTSGQLSKLDLTLQYTPTQNNIDELTLAIVADENGKPGATNLWSEVFVDKTERALSAGYPPPSSYSVANGLSLNEGSTYWVVATTRSESRYPYLWWLEEINKTGTRATYYIQAPTGFVEGEWLVDSRPNRREFGLRVTVIPEPTAAALMLAASATLLAVRRRTISI